MATNDGQRELLHLLEADVRRLEVELEFARERLRRCSNESEAERRAARPTVRLGRQLGTLRSLEAVAPPQRTSPTAPQRGATLSFEAVAMPTPATQVPEASEVRAVEGAPKVARDAGRYELIAEPRRKALRDSARFTGSSR